MSKHYTCHTFGTKLQNKNNFDDHWTLGFNGLGTWSNENQSCATNLILHKSNIAINSHQNFEFASLYSECTMKPMMASTLGFYVKNVLFGSPFLKHCQRPNYNSWPFLITSHISINWHIGSLPMFRIVLETNQTGKLLLCLYHGIECQEIPSKGNNHVWPLPISINSIWQPVHIKF